MHLEREVEKMGKYRYPLLLPSLFLKREIKRAKATRFYLDPTLHSLLKVWFRILKCALASNVDRPFVGKLQTLRKTENSLTNNSRYRTECGFTFYLIGVTFNISTFCHLFLLSILLFMIHSYWKRYSKDIENLINWKKNTFNIIKYVNCQSTV